MRRSAAKAASRSTSSATPIRLAQELFHRIARERSLPEESANHLASCERAARGAVQQTGLAAAASADDEAGGEPARVPILERLLESVEFLVPAHQEAAVFDRREPEQRTVDGGQLALRRRQRQRVAQCGAPNNRSGGRPRRQFAAEGLERAVPAVGRASGRRARRLPRVCASPPQGGVNEAAASRPPEQRDPAELSRFQSRRAFLTPRPEGLHKLRFEFLLGGGRLQLVGEHDGGVVPCVGEQRLLLTL